MIFPFILLAPVGLIVIAYGIWQVVIIKQKGKWPLIAIGLIISVGSLGLLVFSLLVFADGM
jgi:hypothetical protein